MGARTSTEYCPFEVVAINGEGEAATENGQETVVEDAKVNGNGVHGEAELGGDGDNIEVKSYVQQESLCPAP